MEVSEQRAVPRERLRSGYVQTRSSVKAAGGARVPQLTSSVGVRVRVPVKLKSPEAPYAPQSPQPQSSARMKTKDGRSGLDSSPWSSSLSGGIPLQLMLWLAPEMGSLPGSTQQALSATTIVLAS